MIHFVSLLFVVAACLGSPRAVADESCEPFHHICAAVCSVRLGPLLSPEVKQLVGNGTTEAAAFDRLVAQCASMARDAKGKSFKLYVNQASAYAGNACTRMR